MEPSDSQNPEFSFRPSLGVLFVWMTGWALILGWLGSYVLLFGRSFPLSRIPSALIPASVVGVILGLLFSIAFHLALAQTLSPDGIRAHNVFGARRSIRWEHIATVRPFSLVGFKHLRLYSKLGGRPAWLFLQPARKAEFNRTMLALAPADNPIRAYFV